MSAIQQCVKTHAQSGQAVHDAARQGHSSCLTELIQLPADCNKVDSALGWPPILWASYSGQVSCLETLVANGASLFVHDVEHCMTAAHVAAQHGHADCLRWLLVACRSLANAQDFYGDTPGHKAAAQKRKMCLACLEEFGANFEIANFSGQTVTDVLQSSMEGSCARSRHKSADAVSLPASAMVVDRSLTDDDIDVECVDMDGVSSADQLRLECQLRPPLGSQVKRSPGDSVESIGYAHAAKRPWLMAPT